MHTNSIGCHTVTVTLLPKSNSVTYFIILLFMNKNSSGQTDTWAKKVHTHLIWTKNFRWFELQFSEKSEKMKFFGNSVTLFGCGSINGVYSSVKDLKNQNALFVLSRHDLKLVYHNQIQYHRCDIYFLGGLLFSSVFLEKNWKIWYFHVLLWFQSTCTNNFGKPDAYLENSDF